MNVNWDSVVQTEDAPAPAGPYAQGRVVNGFFFSAGFGAFDPSSGRLVGETVGEQTRQVLSNLKAVLAARGLSLNDVVKVNAYLEDPVRDFEEYNTAYEQFFSPPYPARTTVGSRLLNLLVEIEVVAKVSGAEAEEA
jgi:reactive intermediate/imine deaminase